MDRISVKGYRSFKDLSQVMYQVEHADNKDFNEKLSQFVSQVVSQVKGADLEQVVAMFISYVLTEKGKSLIESVKKWK